MNLYLLKYDQYAWDRTMGLVIRADDEEEARKIAAENTRYEYEYRDLPNPWLYAGMTSCQLITGAGEPGIVLRDFNAG
jgi:hypothetical protein